jgi:Bacterial Ig-like domain (group 3)
VEILPGAGNPLITLRVAAQGGEFSRARRIFLTRFPREHRNPIQRLSASEVLGIFFAEFILKERHEPQERKIAMRVNFSPSGGVLAVVGLGGALLLTGCGNFWQAPGSTGSTGTTTTTTTLTASTTTPPEGAAVTLTATVSPSAATGTVTFYDGTTSMGTGTLSSGTATLSISFTSTGAQSLTATYGGSSTYAASTSSAVSVTVSAASSSSAERPAVSTMAPATVATPTQASAAATGATPTSSGAHTTTGYRAAAIRATGAVNLAGGTYTAQDAEAVVVEGSGSVNLTGTALNSTAGDDRGVLLYSSSPEAAATAAASTLAGSTDSAPAGTTRFTMSNGSITYNCNAVSTAACAQGSTSAGQNNPATLFAVANTTAAISLTDVAVTDNTSTDTNTEGSLLTAAALNSGRWGTANANGGNVTFTAKGTDLDGDVIVDAISTAALSLLEDSAGTGSSLTGAINGADQGKTVNLTLDKGSEWTVTGTSYLTAVTGLDLSGTVVNNIDGGGHCVYYSGGVNGSSQAITYSLSGGGYLAPVGTTGLRCE